MIRFRLAQAPLRAVSFVHSAEQVLHVMSDLVGNHIGFGKITRRSEPLLQFIKKFKIQIDLFIAGAIERAHRSVSHAAC